MKPLAPNSMIQNRYLVVHAIGKGGMGEVYLAVDQRLGSAVALKRTFFNEDEALNTAFEREARILARLRHPVLPKVIDHFAENGDQYLVMEHISGDDLSKRLEHAKKAFPLSWVMFWADQMLDALSYLHSHEPPIIHRDIKPQNLKLTDENHIVLLDFGLSKDFDTSTTGNPLNSASVAGYSPHFASMEQIRGTGTDARSDLYSFSATLYQLLTNIIPIDALTRADAMLGGKPDPIVPINELNPEVPPSISDVVIRGIGLRQDERFSNAGEMQKALRRAYNVLSSDVDPSTLMVSGENEKAAPQSAPKSGTFGKIHLEETIDMDDEMPQPAGDLKQADIKTAIYSKPIIEIPETKEEKLDETSIMPDRPTSDSRTEEIVSKDAKTQENVQAVTETPAPPSIPTVVTVPPPVESQPPVLEQEPEAKPTAAAAAAGIASEPAKTPVAAKKKSKAGLIVGLLVGLVAVLGIVSVGGWFAYTKYATVKPTPTPVPSPAASPAPSQTAPVLAESNQNSNTNTSAGTVGGLDVNDNASPNRPSGAPTTQPVTRQTPAQTVTKDVPPPTTKTAPPPAPKTAPKTTKPKDDRTVILQ